MKEKYLFYKERLRTLLREKGMYLVVFASLAAVGAAAAISAGAPEKKNVEATPVPSPATAPVLQSEDERLSGVSAFRTPVPSGMPTSTPAGMPPASPSPSPDATPIPDFTAKPQNADRKKKDEAPRKAVSPVKGSVIWKFAESELIYSQTLDQWMTHHGVDVSAALESEVRAIYAGTVEDVYQDDAFGFTVRMSHGEGMQSLYANLAQDPPVKPGDKLKAGDTLGYVGQSALSECKSPSHLHFEIWKDEKPMDPEEYCLFES